MTDIFIIIIIIIIIYMSYFVLDVVPIICHTLLLLPIVLNPATPFYLQFNTENENSFYYYNLFPL
jgi:hypothetical protein